jgi:hypothetical protein
MNRFRLLRASQMLPIRCLKRIRASSSHVNLVWSAANVRTLEEQRTPNSSPWTISATTNFIYGLSLQFVCPPVVAKFPTS